MDLSCGDALVYTCPYSRQPSATIETSAVWAGDIVYVAASDGTVYGINKEDGKVVWKHATGAPMFGSVALSGNALVVSDFGGNVYLFCKQSYVDYDMIWAVSVKHLLSYDGTIQWIKQELSS